MPTATSTEWLILAVTTVAGLGFTAAAWWALFGDRARGRRRCPQCWHDLSFTPGLRCSECGHLARSDRDLHRTHRRHAVGLLALFGAAIIGVRGIDAVVIGAWPQYLPTSALVRCLGAGDRLYGPAERELLVRSQRNRLTLGHWTSILDVAARGSDDARPGSDGWPSRYGRWARDAWRQIEIDGDDAAIDAAEATILDLAVRHRPRIELEAPPRWPAGQPIPVGVIVSEPWQVPLPTRLEATSSGGPGQAWARFGDPIQRRAFTITLPAQAAGRRTIPVSITASRARDAESDWIAGETIELQAFVPIVEPAGESPAAPSPGSPSTLADPGPALEPVSDDRMAALVHRVFDNGAVQWQRGSLPVRVRVSRTATAAELFSDVAIGLEVEVLRNGRLGRTLLLWWLGGQVTTGPNAWEVPFVDDAVLGPPTTEADVWTMRVRGREDLARRVPGATRWWRGQFERPIRVEPRSGPAPSRGWVRVPALSVDPSPAPGPADSRSDR